MSGTVTALSGARRVREFGFQVSLRANWTERAPLETRVLMPTQLLLAIISRSLSGKPTACHRTVTSSFVAQRCAAHRQAGLVETALAHGAIRREVATLAAQW